MGCQAIGTQAGYEQARTSQTQGSLLQLDSGLALPKLKYRDFLKLWADGQIDELKNYLGYGEYEGAIEELQTRGGAFNEMESKPQSLAQLVEDHQNGKVARHWR